VVHRLYVSLERFAARRCNHLIAITPAMVEAFKQHRIAPPEKFTIIPSGVELSRFDATLDRGEAKRSFGLPSNRPVVGLIARLDPLKGHRDLLAAWPAIACKVPGARVLFVGDGFDAAGIRAETSALPGGLSERVAFAGFVPFEQMSRAYRACDVVALPSYQEGQSRVLVEALWCGCAVVGYDVGGIGSVCIDGVTGRLVPVGDRRNLGDAIVELLTDHEKAEATIARGRAHVAEHFSADRMNHELLSLYERLMTGGPS
jgi:glycosyltransferase involved in cell wall biosynthesis